MTDYSETALVRGMSYLADAQASIAHNLANVGATGFKRRIALADPQSFTALLDSKLPTVGFAQHTDWTNGTLTATGDKLHVALEGKGFFQVQTDDGQRLYTRSGTMLIDKLGRLVDPAGHRYLDPTGQEINIGPAEEMDREKLRIAPDGKIDAGDTSFGQLGLFDVPDSGRLEPLGQSLYADQSNARPVIAINAKVRQGHLEQSNVDSLNELVRMITVQRSFQATAKALSSLSRIQTAFVNAVNR